ncbi:Uncharacterised protein [Listeria grayi]|uniref:Uncharacterized protein n=1 Tax=Listeria grayi TaxID=1641 RepID=A0A378MBI0_LISGR|nr:hypothetical protein [Listeria grayi]STY43690.1 Uncharacterised protein [Listeria grayi]
MSLLLFYYSFSVHLIFSLFFLLQGVAFSKRHAFITAALLIAANFSCLFLDRFQTIALVIAFYIVAFIQKKSVLLSVFRLRLVGLPLDPFGSYFLTSLIMYSELILLLGHF